MGCGSCGSSGCSGCHSCNSCGSSSCNWGCGCGCAVPAGCNPSLCQTSYPNCGTVPPANPNPYYIQSAQCQENHCEQIINNYYSPQVCVSYGFNIPGCGLTAVIYFSDVPKLLVGAYLWHPTYGYFKVIAFNSQTGQTTILNTCEEGNAAPGTAIPACTCFIVTPEPVDIAQIGAVCVAIDFTAPNLYDCLLITVTNVNGLVVGGLVGIGSGIYLLSEINSNTTVTICNEGQGITPGTPVIALDAAGNYQYCLSILGVSPCTQPEVEEGQAMVCAGGAAVPLLGNTIGQVLQVTSTSPQLAAFGDLGQQLTRVSNTATNKTGLITNTQTLQSNTASISITNTTNKTMQIFGTLEFFIQGNVTDAGGDVGFGMTMDAQVNGGGFSTIKAFNDGFYVGGALTFSRIYTLALGVTLAAGGTYALDTRFSVLNLGADSFDVLNMAPSINAIGIALHG